jgi:integrase
MTPLLPLHLTWLQAGGRSPRTITARQRLLRHADLALPYGLDQADPDELAAYLATPGWSAWTRHTYYGHLAGYYRWAVLFDHLTLDPTIHLIRPGSGDRVPDPATDAELVAALRRLPEQPWRMAVRLAAYAGLRCHEIVTCRREDCTADVLRVRGKGGRVQTVPMAPPLWAVVQHRPRGLLVLAARGRPLTAGRLTQMQGPVWARIGQPHQHLHRFRHWFATTMLRAGADIRTVQECLRHASLQSTQTYTAVVDHQREAAVRLLPQLEEAAAGV